MTKGLDKGEGDEGWARERGRAWTCRQKERLVGKGEKRSWGVGEGLGKGEGTED